MASGVRSEPRLVGPGHDDYPEGLYDLEHPPTLFCLGKTKPRPAVAVVGTRRATSYGIGVASALGTALAGAGWITVSGLARGIDGAAQRAAIAAGGESVAVLGSGIDVAYPRENRGLYSAIADGGGAVFSEYPPGTPPDRWRFPARNRIIAAVASAVVVVEAGDTGGALITARLGAEIGRPVFAVPGDIDRPMSRGTNALIRDGAIPALGAQDLIEGLSVTLGPPLSSTSPTVSIPSTGASIESLPLIWGCSPSEAMARLARLEIAGELRRVGDRVLPGENAKT